MTIRSSLKRKKMSAQRKGQEAGVGGVEETVKWLASEYLSLVVKEMQNEA